MNSKLKLLEVWYDHNCTALGFKEKKEELETEGLTDDEKEARIKAHEQKCSQMWSAIEKARSTLREVEANGRPRRHTLSAINEDAILN